MRIDDNKLFCLAGTTVSQLLSYCRVRGLGGLEHLAGIPATIGGLAYMNGGAGGKYISSNILSVKLYGNTVYNLSNKNCNFGYKHSTMRNINDVVLGVFLSVRSEDPPSNIERQILNYSLRRRFLPKGRSCGCVFKNPPGLSAGKIIDNCGLAGYGNERTFVSPQHCNFIINNGAMAIEVRELIEDVKRIVSQKCGIFLEEEVVYVGKFT